MIFTLVITDFGVPKVIGGQFNVLATDIYKQVIGQQNFEMGATVAAAAFALNVLVLMTLLCVPLSRVRGMFLLLSPPQT